MNSLSYFICLFLVSVVVADDCTVTSYDNAANAAKTCSSLTISSMTVPAGKTLELDMKDGATLKFSGTIKFGVSNWSGPLVKIKGNGITVDGSGGTLDGQGASYWDGKGSSGSTKPKFFRIQATGGSVFNKVTLKNCPVQCVSIGDSDHVTLDGWTVDVSAGDTNALGHNTDGFDISSSTYVLIQNTKVYNQDDCIAVNRGSHMTFYNMYCSGGHGLSMSVGQSSENGDANTVQDINFLDSEVTNSDNGIHIKTHSDAGTGACKDVTYKNIKMSNIRKYGINIQEDYENGSSSGNPKDNIPITNLVFDNIQGACESSATGVYILCASGGCSNWSWSNVKITGQKKNSCNYQPSGFSC